MEADRVSTSDQEASDEELLARGIDGDQAAFTTLMRRHEDRIFSLALRMMGNRSDALDATQDAFVSAYRKGRSFEGDSAFSTWLYRVAVNACKDLLRKRARTPLPSEELPEPRSDRPSEAEEIASRLEVREALAQLADDYREAVVMHDLGGIPYEEIAQVTGAALGTVKSRISRGRKRLAEILEQQRSDRASNDSENEPLGG